MFADPFNTAGLVHRGGAARGLRLRGPRRQEHRKIVFNSPEELYDLLVFIGAPARFAVKRVVVASRARWPPSPRRTGSSLIAGRYVGKDDPTAIVRCQGDFPAVGEVLEPFTHAAPRRRGSCAARTTGR